MIQGRKKIVESILDLVFNNCGDSVQKCIDTECIYYEHKDFIIRLDDTSYSYLETTDNTDQHRPAIQNYTSIFTQKEELDIWLLHTPYATFAGIVFPTDCSLLFYIDVAARILGIPVVRSSYHSRQMKYCVDYARSNWSM